MTKSGKLMRCTLLIAVWCTMSPEVTRAQEVPITDYAVNEAGQVQLTVESTREHYYILKVRHEPTGDFDLAVSMTPGSDGTTIISEPLGHYPQSHYQVLEYALDDPADTDEDGFDDVEEFENRPVRNPLNAADSLSLEDGAVILDSFSLFNQLSVSAAFVQFVEFLNGKRYAKFVIEDFEDSPKVYFINGSRHELHADFISAMDLDVSETFKKGQIIYHPTIVAENGSLGTFGFNFSDGHGEDFEVLQRTHELLAASMPFLKNNLSYYVTERSLDEYDRDSALIAASRIPVIFEEDVFGEVDYWGLNQKEGYGFFRVLNGGDVPDITDIVLLDELPNTLPRVGGIITSVVQTPLSHVNLRAIQDNVPNAFIRDPLSIDSVAALLNDYVYFNVDADKFTLRKASKEEVDAWYENVRPTEVQYPPLNMDFRFILPLDEVSFSMFDGFGTKCANVATMRTFGFPDGTIPDGFGVPFYFYQEFMAYNDLFAELNKLLEDESFHSDRDVREAMLAQFAHRIEEGVMPGWMLRALADMQTSFPRGTSIRCRSSSNNEDLPGLNGAGLYESRTHHPDEGHIEKSIKEVYASLWNLRAFDEREFYRIDHYKTSMGVLCHPNFEEEQANGVGVSADPVYQTYNSFYYLNTQVGEDLITNPSANASPEEILLDRLEKEEHDYILIRNSSLVEGDSIILQKSHRDALREYLTVIHDRFKVLYGAEENESFAMEIEFKVTSDGQLAIKQARPWVSYAPEEDITADPRTEPEFVCYPNPATTELNAWCKDCKVSRLVVYAMNGEVMKQVPYPYKGTEAIRFSVEDLSPGLYLLAVLRPDGSVEFTEKFVRSR